MSMNPEFSYAYGQPPLSTVADDLYRIRQDALYGQLALGRTVASQPTAESLTQPSAIDSMLVRGIGKAAAGLANSTDDIVFRFFHDGEARLPAPAAQRQFGAYALAA